MWITVGVYSGCFYKSSGVDKILMRDYSSCIMYSIKQAEYSHIYYLKNKDKIAFDQKERRKNKKEAISIYNKEYRMKNKEKIAISGINYRKERGADLSRSNKEWRTKNKEYLAEYDAKRAPGRREIVAKFRKKKYSTDVQYRLSCRLRCRLREKLKGKLKKGSSIDDLGCTLEELKIHLEGKFLPGMTWNNHGSFGWHIDHEIPLDFFDLTDKEQLLKACHYTNLQPMWWKENLEKGSKIISDSLQN